VALEFNPGVSRIPVYPAAEGYAHTGPLVRLASNESPDPPLPEVIEAASRALSGLNRYPDPTNGALRRRLGERYEVRPERIAVGNGSCDILLAAGQALLEPGAELIYAWPSFSVYPHLAAASGARAVTVDLDGAQRHDLDAMAAQITAATRLIIVCNPNNPTSTAVSTREIGEFLERVPPQVCVILDEAYAEFKTLEDPDSALDLLDVAPGVVLGWYDEIVAAVRMAADGGGTLSCELASSMLAEVKRTTTSPAGDAVISPREEEVLQLVADGLSLPEVAVQLFISVKTVKNHLGSIYAKLDARDRTQAVLRAVRMGIIRLD